MSGQLVLIGLVFTALLFDFLNGLHDSANSIATVVATRVLRPVTAVVWASFFNFIAFTVFGLHVAATIGNGVVNVALVDSLVVFGALAGAIFWNVLTWWLGIPSSSSHALVGGLVDIDARKGLEAQELDRLAALERLQTVGRELEMIELKKEIESLRSLAHKDGDESAASTGT